VVFHAAFTLAVMAHSRPLRRLGSSAADYIETARVRRYGMATPYQEIQ
jgi:hypothetical protein